MRPSQVLVREGDYGGSDVTWSALTPPPPDLSLSCYVPGLLVTAGTDDTVKFWDIHVSEALLPTSCDRTENVIVE